MLSSYLPALVSGTPAGALPFLQIPDGPTQTIDELQGASTISAMTAKCIDPTGAVKSDVAINNFIGTQALFKLGFLPSTAFPCTYSDFVTLHTMQVYETAWDKNGLVTFTMQDPLRYQVYQVFFFGGPAFWAPGEATPPQPVGPNYVTNQQPINTQNPLWLQGNPIDIYLAVMQNFIGIGQSTTTQTSWQIYNPVTGAGLINPNPFIDVPTALSLKANYFAGDWMEFKLTDAEVGKSFVEDQICKPLGLYSIVRSTGQISLKTMKSPPSTTPIYISNAQIIGIPDMKREKPINVVRWRIDATRDNVNNNTSAKNFDTSWVFWNPTSILRYGQQYITQVESKGLRANRGGMQKGSLYSNRVFSRHAFGTPRYSFDCSFSFIGVELADYVNITHPAMLDFTTGTLGMRNVMCEVVNRQPHYDKGYMHLEVLDTRFMNLTTPPSLIGTGTIGSATIF